MQNSMLILNFWSKCEKHAAIIKKSLSYCRTLIEDCGRFSVSRNPTMTLQTLNSCSRMPIRIFNQNRVKKRFKAKFRVVFSESKKPAKISFFLRVYDLILGDNKIYNQWVIYISIDAVFDALSDYEIKSRKTNCGSVLQRHSEKLMHDP
mgnify:CR=1 FL=1